MGLIVKMNTKIFIGDHGSSSNNCKLIREQGFKKSFGGWLGQGVYFFEDDKDLARSWAQSKYSHNRVEVLEGSINVSIENLLDISDPKGEQCKHVNEIKEQLLKIGLNKDFIIHMESPMFDGKVLDYVCEEEHFDVVRNFTHTRTQLDRKFNNLYSAISNGVEICVRNLSCISLF